MNRSMYILRLALCSVTCFAFATATAAPEVPVAFVVIDSDHNGYVSRVEARSVEAVESRFDAADTNRDGLLDEQEYRGLGHARTPR